ncbi:chitinase putative [Entamoeba histolytica]|nr:chitinase, putative [Entamoeba histolytica HM-1:IMSS-A]GAT98612.1 chitinase putative [Entamoeba histolytica]
MILLFLNFFLFVLLSEANDSLCYRQMDGFYCLDDTLFIWCYGYSEGFVMRCSSGTLCKCGFTRENPCLLSMQESADCVGNPGDIKNLTFQQSI